MSPLERHVDGLLGEALQLAVKQRLDGERRFVARALGYWMSGSKAALNAYTLNWNNVISFKA